MVFTGDGVVAMVFTGDGLVAMVFTGNGIVAMVFTGNGIMVVFTGNVAAGIVDFTACCMVVNRLGCLTEPIKNVYQHLLRN